MLERLLAPIKQKIILMIGKAVITAAKDNEAIQLVQIDMGNDEKIDSVERIQNFGFTSFPVSGSEAVVICIAGDREHPIVIATDSGEHRPKLNSGESVMYSSGGMRVKVKNDSIELGVTSLKKLVNDSFQSMFNNHVHNISVAGTAAAQTGISSSPVSSLGTLPIAVAPIPTTVYIQGKAIGNTELTSKVEAQ